MKNRIEVDEYTNIELNEQGNISKLEKNEVFSETKGNYSKTFCYLIDKNAGLSIDKETGELFPVYCQIKIDYENEMKNDTLDFAHKIYYKNEISKKHGIDLEHITPVSEEEYNKQMNN